MPINPLIALRMQNLFPSPQLPNQFPTVSQPDTPPPTFQSSNEEPPINVADRMNALYHPSTRSMDMYAQRSNAMPQRDQYKPSGLRRVGAMIAGLNAKSGGDAFNTSSGIVNRPYDTAIKDWENSLEPLKANAIQEEQRNKEDRLNAENTITREINSRKESDANRNKQKDQEIRLQGLQDSYNKAQKQLELMQSRLEADKDNREKINAYHQAQLDAQKAQHALENSLNERKLAEQAKQHENQRANWETQRKDYEDRTKLWAEYNKARLAGKSTDEYIFDKENNLIGKKNTTVNPSGQGGTVMMLHPDGKTKGPVKISDKEAALKAGYKLIEPVGGK